MAQFKAQIWHESTGSYCYATSSITLSDQNQKSFIASRYDHISINPSSVAMQLLNRHGLIEMGFHIMVGL